MHRLPTSAQFEILFKGVHFFTMPIAFGESSNPEIPD